MEQNESKMKYFIKKMSFPSFVFFATTAAVFFLVNFLLNVILEVVQKTFMTGSILEPEPLSISASMFFDFPYMSTSFILYVTIFIISVLVGVVMAYKYISNFGKLKKDQKGSARFTTFKEIKMQYRDVPDKAERFDGGGGIPVARYEDRLFIDDSPVNNMIIGTTRSGKGETFVFSTIDIYSRAEKQASMILNDPKGELYAASKDTLEGLGYHVEVLNLMNPLQSMSYNLLQLTIDAFMEENYSLAQQYARSVAFMLYYDPKSKDPFWSNSSTDLCTAIILALCEQCKDEPEKINMYNVALMLADLGTRTVTDDNGNEVSALDDFFSKFPENHPAKMQYATINFSGGQTRASILANTNAKLGVFTLDGTAKLTSQNSFDMSKIGFSRWIKGKSKPVTRINITFNNEKIETIRTDAEGMFTLYHKSPLRVGDSFIVSGDGFETKIEVIENCEQGFFKVKENNDDVKISTVVDHDKPVAIFMIVPDYDATFNVIASLYVKQVYTNLARIASNAEGGKCHREVIFILDEFGNMPAIEGMANIVTVCLGRNIRFNLIIQAYAQLENLYGDDWKTIDGNCGNTLYLLTADESTAELISKKLGEQTIVTKSRSGQTFSLSKSKTESVDSRRLMTATEVMGLKEGEMIVIRVIKRQDKERNRIRSYPIYLHGKTALKYRWEYLADYYNTDKSINEIDIPCSHAMTDLNKLKAKFMTNNFQKRLLEQSTIQEERMQEIQNIEEREFREEKTQEIQNIEEIEFHKNKEEQRLLEKKKVDEEVALVKREKSKLRNQERKAQLQKEEEINHMINETVKVSSILPKGFLVGVFGEIHTAEYMNLGILDFKEIVISKQNEIEEKKCAIILSKVESTINQILDKGSVKA